MPFKRRSRRVERLGRPREVTRNESDLGLSDDASRTVQGEVALDSGLFDLRGKTAVITGAARGLGRAAAAALGRHGADLVLFDKLGDELEATAADLGLASASVHPVTGDITRDDDVERLVGALRDGVDVIVNSVGVQRRMPISEVTVHDLDWMWQVNVRGVFALTQALLPGMISRGHGKIINVASIGSVVGAERKTIYAMTKGAIAQYTRNLAIEVGQHGICVNAVAPGYVDTEMTHEWLYGEPDRTRAFLGRIPLGRFATPADTEGAFVLLATRASDYITGQLLIIDGGWTSW